MESSRILINSIIHGSHYRISSIPLKDLPQNVIENIDWTLEYFTNEKFHSYKIDHEKGMLYIRWECPLTLKDVDYLKSAIPGRKGRLQ